MSGMLTGSLDSASARQPQVARLPMAAYLGGEAHPVGQGIAMLGFMAVLPGYFVYHSLVSAGMPAFLRGYSVLVAALVTPLVAIGLLQAVAAGQRLVWVDAALLAFVGLFGGAALVGAVGGASGAIVASHLGSIPQWLALFGIARLLDPLHPTVRRLALASWLLMSAIVLANVSEGSFLLAALDVPVGDRDMLATYQDFALVYLIVTTMCLVGLRSNAARVPLLLVATVVLFLNGARSEFLALWVAALLIGWCLARRRLALVGAVLALAAAAWLAIEPLSGLLPDNRVIDLIENQAEGSLGERREMHAAAWQTLAEHPITGQYGSYAPGEYAHNIVSAWVDLGVVGFVLLVLLLGAPLLELTLGLAARGRDPRAVLALTLLLLSALLLLTAKFFTYNLVPFALGVYAFDLARRSRRRPGGGA